MDQKILDKIIKNLQSRVNCPVCNHKFKKDEIVFRGFLKEVYLFEFQCPNCSTMLLAKVLVNNKNTENGKLTATPKNPTKQFKMPRQKISSNDIINLHKDLNSFKGKSLKELF